MSERDSWPEAPSLDDPPGGADEAPEEEVEASGADVVAPEPDIEAADAEESEAEVAEPRRSR